MGFTLDARPFLTGLATAAVGLERAGERALAGAGEAASHRAAALAPVGSGELAASAFVEEGRDADGFFADVGFTADHAAEVEFGTSDRPPRPFLRPALAELPGALARVAT